MKIETQVLEDHQMKVIAEFETSALEKYKHQAARKIANKSKIPGFRPGKAPYDVILRIYGEEALSDEAVELMVEDIYPQMLTEAKIEPAAPGSLQDIDKGDPLKFTFVVPLEPTVDMAGYKDIRKKYTLKPVAAKEVDEFIDRLKRNYATAEPVERAAKVGDLVYIKLDAEILNPGEDDKPELLKDSPMQVVIGETDPNGNDFPYEGFGDNLIKLKAGGTKKVKYTYPADSRYEKLRGMDVEFSVLVESVKELKLPEFDDAFAQTVGEFESVDKLRESIHDQLESRARDEYESTWFEELIDQIVAQSVIKFPPQVVEHEMEHVVETVQEDLTRQKMELDTYLKTIKKEKDAWLEEDIKPVAKKRLERSLVMEEIAKLEKIQVKNEDLQEEVSNMIHEMQMQGNVDFKKLEKQLKNERIANNMAMQAASRLINRKTLDRMKEIATGKAESAPSAEGAPSDAAAKPAAKKKAAPKAEKSVEPAADVAEKPVKAKKPAKKAADDKAE
ncbi:MAG: trigger factor [Chloroflexi bacterium HGW-Chloroflexi-5]|nr:MAG: trigger factor [Chloroflexi bacterium HGW-Chloroflexi-5]